MPYKSKKTKREYNKEYYRKHNDIKNWVLARDDMSPEDFKQWRKDERNRKSREKYARNKQIIDKYKLLHPCLCGEDNITCLEFHHRDPSKKNFQISDEGKKKNVETLNKEIAKCDILCKNCHTKFHNKDIKKVDYEQLIADIDMILATKLDKLDRRKIYAKKQKFQSRILVRDYKKENNCKNCGEKEPMCLVFHHRDPSEKTANIPQLYKHGHNRVKREIDKCDLLCHNCHSKHHHIEDHPFKLAYS